VWTGGANGEKKFRFRKHPDTRGRGHRVIIELSKLNLAIKNREKTFVKNIWKFKKKMVKNTRLFDALGRHYQVEKTAKQRV